MITRDDLEAAIAECQGERNPNANTCIKLAAFYTILNNLEPQERQETYSNTVAPIAVGEDRVAYRSGSDFARAVNGKKASKAWEIMDELLDAVKILNYRTYAAVMDELKNMEDD